MLIRDVIDKGKNKLLGIIEDCNSILLIRDDNLLLQDDLKALAIDINIQGLVSILHTVNLFGGEQGYNKIRQIEFQELNVVYTNFQDYTIAFLFDTHFEKHEIRESIEFVINIIYSIYRGLSTISRPSTEIEITAAIIAVLFLSIGEVGNISYCLFESSDLNRHVEELEGVLSKYEYQELKEITFEEFKESVTIDNLLHELQREITEVSGSGIYSVGANGDLQLSSVGEISPEQEEQIIKIYLENAEKFIRLFQEMDKHVSFNLEGQTIYFHSITDFSGIYLLVPESYEIEKCANMVEKFSLVMRELFPDKVLVR